MLTAKNPALKNYRQDATVSRGALAEAARRLGMSPQALAYRLRRVKDPLAVAMVSLVDAELRSKRGASAQVDAPSV